MKLDMRAVSVERNGTNSGGGTWEYRSGKFDAYEDCLDQYGAEGWELVNVIPAPADPGMVIAYFKRRRS